MSTSSDRGRFVWYDLMTGDPGRAIEFYTKVVGWGTHAAESPGGGPSYTMWTANGTPIGGIMPFPADIPADATPHWLGYVSVPDVAETARQVAALDGRVLLQPSEVPGAGRFMTFADPQGALIAAYTPANAMPEHEGPPRPGEFAWHELATTNHERAFEFYSALFGWERTTAMDMGAMGTYQLFGRNGMDLGGMYDTPPEMPMPPHWCLYATVVDTDAALERVKANGGMVLNGPMDVPGGSRVAQCLDPSGAAFALVATPK